ncbi:MAG: hypothetical protein ACQETQ_04495 [Spirochaetota bacterium]
MLLLILLPLEAPGRNLSWTMFAAQSEPADDPIILEVLSRLELSEALAVAGALPNRPVPDLSTVFSGLLQGKLDERDELFMRVALEGLLALTPSERDNALESNRETLSLLFENMSRLDSPMLRSVVWRAAALSSQPVRQELLPEARTAAAALYRRADDRTARSRSRRRRNAHPTPPTMAPISPAPEREPEPQDEGTPRGVYAQETYEALGFLAFARNTPDRTLVALVDQLRRRSRDPVFVQRAREMLAEYD